jgi:phosphatidylglycerophosphatase A
MAGRTTEGRPEGGFQSAIARHVSRMGPLGLSPFAPGTLGAMAAIPAAALLGDGHPWRWAAAIAGLSIAGFAAVAFHLRAREEADPRDVVVDETLGCLIAAAFVPCDPVWIAAAFVGFRALDILKPWPIGAIDERVHGAFGVLADDVAAGVLAGGCAALVRAVVSLLGA